MAHSVAEDFKDLLDADSALGLTFNTDLFVGELPTEDSAQDNVVCVKGTGGSAPQDALDASHVYDHPTIQVLVRNRDYVTGDQLAHQVRTFLHNTTNQTVNSSRYIGIWAAGDVIPLGRDQNRRAIFSCNFRAHRTDA